MKCMHCQGTMWQGKTPLHVDRKGYQLSLDAVPAWICGQCGEAYFEEREVERIERVLTQLDQQTSALAPVA